MEMSGMRHVKIELASPSDDEALRLLQSQSSMPGVYRLSYLRDPSFFKALDVEGVFHQTIVGRDQTNGAIVGWGNRSVRPAYVNGKQQEIGYLSGLRFSGGYDNIFAMLRGYKKLRQLHQDSRAGFYLTTVLNRNTRAQKFLTSGQRELPQYHDYGQLHCKAVSLSQALFKVKKGEVFLRQATGDDLQDILEFIHDEGQKKQFYPVYQAEDFFAPEGPLTGLAVHDLLLAFSGNRLVGVAGAWDQQSLRAVKVAGYARWLAAGRPVYNLWARLNRYPILPSPGKKLNCFYLSLVAVHNDDPEIFKNLLNGLMLRNRNRYDLMMAGLHNSHPLMHVLKKLKGNNYRSQLYLVFWQDGAKAVSMLEERPVYLELGTL